MYGRLKNNIWQLNIQVYIGLYSFVTKGKEERYPLDFVPKNHKLYISDEEVNSLEYKDFRSFVKNVIYEDGVVFLTYQGKVIEVDAKEY